MRVKVKTKGQLEQIFLFLTLNCNCQCITCYMHKHYSTIKEISFKTANDTLRKYYCLGAKKLTLMGGEPTLYTHLEELLKFAKNIGYLYIRIQTNGQFDSNLLAKPLVRKNVTTFCFSIDGDTEVFNRRIRKGCSLNKTLENMRRAKQLGYDIRVNVTVTSINIDHIFYIISLAESIGVSMVYLNIVFPIGATSDHSYLTVSPEQWISTFKLTKENSHKFQVGVKVPVGYSFDDPEDHHCIALKMSRLYIMTNGDTYPCILFVDKPELRLDAHPYWNKLVNYAKESLEEINDYCHFLKLHKGGLKPLCLYYRKVFGNEKHRSEI